jgi:serine/threonine protein kinase
MREIGPFEILGLLGRGGMSKVYKVRHPRRPEVVALKILSPQPILKDLLGEASLKRQFVHEAGIMARLNHPHIVTVKECSRVDGVPYYLMDYYCNNLGFQIGETYMPENPSRAMSPDKALKYIGQTLEGLSCLHQAGIVHRDLKPFNLLLTDNDLIKIGDFGLALWRGESYSGPPNLKVGSPYYAAPEQEENPDQADSRSDLYSVGVILYRLLLGRLPLNHWETPSLHHPEFDGPWDAFMRTALARNKAERFQNAGDMLDRIQELAADWRKKTQEACRENGYNFTAPQKVCPSSKSLRSTPVRTGPKKARSFFGLDPLWRPQTYISPDIQAGTPETLYDNSSNLLWQQKGSPFPLTWEEGSRYVDRLNAEGFAGHQTWRLPTIDELGTLLHPYAGAQEGCLDPLFDPSQKSLWSSDRRSFVAAWLVNVELGFIAWQDFSCHNYVRAVTAFTPKERRVP